MQKTNAIRILEKHGLSFTTHIYTVDENDLSGMTVARKINTEPETVFKTLVLTGDKQIFIFCVPVIDELDLKKAAKITIRMSGNYKPINRFCKFRLVFSPTTEVVGYSNENKYGS